MINRYGEKKKKNENKNPSRRHFKKGDSLNGDLLNTSTSLQSKEDIINHHSPTPQLGFIPVHIPVGSVPYEYTTILHPIYYPSFPPPDNPTAQITSDESNHSKCNNAAEVASEVEKEDSRELQLMNKREL